MFIIMDQDVYKGSLDCKMKRKDPIKAIEACQKDTWLNLELLRPAWDKLNNKSNNNYIELKQ